ncbi:MULTISPECIES: response regulator transcription factor [unclassified Enterococcus]|uniref:response regulator transcription factor n=1 Tax=unclassified Enterococcus TaxID=2608891 RepID=UPI0015530CC9|nr:MULTISPECIES: response regulator transcription factor [unclassified Enterococcus]MBS7577587.1 response regulator transcription factor [Enterococcus sp. MMGLQ5-2]MBS7584914.1 response regulator transcription factor [Enterococcus sp. MMGLQ5-1]NPD12769.1 response regulator transcription factor [Enterococcus sp. MMGLQ5-1]NPD37420.1 response regulator transcription factor [Enterococcus sp. MMGLQ5-2]
MNVLIVEDEILISQLIQDFLVDAGYNVTVCLDGQTAMERFDKNKFDLVILDIMLPGKSGLEILTEIRNNSDIPIIMLTALNDEQTQIICFNQKIDDYVAKPFSPTILVKRVENILNRRSMKKEDKLVIGELEVIIDNCEVKYKGETIELTKKEHDIFTCLVKKSNSIVTRESIIHFVWSYDDFVDTRIIDNHIRNLRKKIPNAKITTVKGIGYKFEGVR